MHRLIGICAIVMLALLSVAVVYAQDATTTTVDGQITELTVVTELVYGSEVFELDVRDGTVLVGFIESRTTTGAGSTVEIVVFGHDAVGWRALGVLTGEASGPLQSAAPGQVVTLSIVGDDQ